METIYTILFNEIFFFLVFLILSFAFFILARKILIKKQFGQVVRDDGPKTHLKKSGTPTMAGIVFIITFLIFEFLLLVFKDYVKGTMALKINIFIIIFGFIGFIDDYLKVTKKNTKGLPSLFKLILQILFAGFFLIICIKYNTMSNIFMFIFLIFIIVGTNNGVNFTDGLDGLCAMVTIVVSIFYIILSIKYENNEFLLINIVILSMLLSFMYFNHYPAKLFMGDTGSLFLGAYVAFMAIMFKIEFLLPIYGFIYMIEVLSVIIQVGYFKISGGKRIFKMAPIHHHFEKCGLSENKIVIMFTLITVILCVITYYIIGVL